MYARLGRDSLVAKQKVAGCSIAPLSPSRQTGEVFSALREESLAINRVEGVSKVCLKENCVRGVLVAFVPLTCGVVPDLSAEGLGYSELERC